jgi:hypothetical protein
MVLTDRDMGLLNTLKGYEQKDLNWHTKVRNGDVSGRK